MKGPRVIIQNNKLQGSDLRLKFFSKLKVEHKQNEYELIKELNPQSDTHGENYHALPHDFTHICDNLFLHLYRSD